ncbi:methyl-accepting chemotaxis protein [Variovorax sp. GT1P44]
MSNEADSQGAKTLSRPSRSRPAPPVARGAGGTPVLPSTFWRSASMNILTRMKIAARLGAAFAVVLAVVLLISGLSLMALADASARFDLYVNGINARAKMADQVRTAVDRRALAARNLVLVTKPADFEVEKALVNAAHEDVKSSLAQLKKMVMAADASDRARSLVAEIDKVEQSYGPVALAIVDLALKGRKAEAIARMDDECRPLLAALIEATNNYAKFTEGRSQELIQEAGSLYASERNVLVISCLAAFMAAALAGLLVTRSITVPIAQAVKVAETVAAGDLTSVVHSASADETGQLLTALKKMNDSLVTIVGQVRNSSDSIATGSAQIATGNADLSQRTEEQANNLQQTAASMEQLTSTVKQNAETARQANQLATGCSEAARQGGEVVERVVSTMDVISQSSRKIAEIIGVIDGIAFQTNILALNAAVEAARAGEQGRGFAVVAGEVRNLAQRSALAAREIKALIGESVDKVESGAQLVGEAGRSMGEIVMQVQRVSDLIAEISASSAEQSTGMGQIGHAVTQLDQVTQQNAALVEESAAAAESLKHQAAGLAAAVSAFKLGTGEGRLPYSPALQVLSKATPMRGRARHAPKAKTASGRERAQA